MLFPCCGDGKLCGLRWVGPVQAGLPCVKPFVCFASITVS